MSKQKSHSTDITELIEESRQLLEATANTAGDKIGEVRRRLTSALERVKQGAQVADKVVHKHPYKALGIAAGIGLLIGYFLSSRNSKKPESEE